jgi:hypothetical protein
MNIEFVMTESMELLKRLVNECEPWQSCDADFLQCYFCGNYLEIEKSDKQQHDGSCLFTAAQRFVEKADLLAQESFVVREDGKLYRRIPPRYNLSGE